MRIIFKNKKNKKTLVGEKKLYQIQKFLYFLKPLIKNLINLIHFINCY